MKLSNIGIFGLPFFIAGILALTACGQKKEENSASRANSVSGNGSGPINPGGYTELGTYVTARSNSGSTTNYEQNVIGLISAKWNSSSDAVGTMDDRSVVLVPYIEQGTGNQVSLTSSRIRLWIYDSYARDRVVLDDGKEAQPYYIDIKGASAGTFTASSFSATFRDEWTEITLQGNYSGNTANGTVSYRNLKDFNGGSLKSAQPMGYFTTATCSVINCRRQ